MRRPFKWALWTGAALLVASLLFLVALQAAISLAGRSLPPIVQGDEFLELVPQTSRLLAADGTTLGEYFVERRTVVPLSSLPDYVIPAILSVEDKRFLNHSGVSPVAIFRAFIVNALSGQMNQGGSTLTQQLAKNLYLTHERTLWRKLREAAIAQEMESRLTKEEILYQYINLIYWGHGNFGIEEASRFYFGKSASALSLSEATLLAGMIKGPEYLSPIKRPEKASNRQAFVLKQMERMGPLPAGANQVTFPAIVGKRELHDELSPYGVDAALAQVRPSIGGESLLTGGYTIVTTLSPAQQGAVNDAIDSLVPTLGVRPRLSGDRPPELCTCLDGGRLLPGCPAWAQIVQRNADGDLLVDLLGRPSRVPLQALAPPGMDSSWSDSLPPGSWIRVMAAQEVLLASPWDFEEPVAIPLLEPQVAALLLERKSGRILAIYGGLDHQFHPFNRVLSAYPGPSPLQVAEALRAGDEPKGCVPAATVVQHVTRAGEPAQHEPRPCLPTPSTAARAAALGQPAQPQWFVWQTDNTILVVWVGSDEGRVVNSSKEADAHRIGREVVRRLQAGE